uniref:Ig-like domain-containing protein n=1 Tax=Lates calcarifer TaxID=8187 RepID=A0A4W6C1Y0_LATCA
MLQLKNEQPLKPQPRAFRALVFHHAVFFLLLTHHCGGQPQMVSPSQPIVAVVGDDVMLPCHLEPAMDASEMTVEWTRPDLEPRFVHVWRSGVELENKKHPSYMRRTSLSPNRLKHGDISLTLPRVKLSDEGTYKCFVPTISRESTVELVVGAVSSLNIILLRPGNEEGTRAVVLECESKGWYPEPEVLWLDGEGNLLSAGPTETVRGPDDLYTVSSRVTVEKRHSNSFTCRVQQNKTNQARETHIHVPDDVFVTCHESNIHILVIVAAGFLFIASIAVFIVVWKWRPNKSKMNKMKDVKERGEEEEKVEVMEILMGQRNQQENLRDQLRSELKEVETEMSEKKQQLEYRNKLFLSSILPDEVKANLAETCKELEKRRVGLEECLNNSEKQLQTTDEVIARMTAAEKEREETQKTSKNLSCHKEEVNETAIMLASREEHYSEP